MSGNDVTRAVSADGQIRLATPECSFTFRRLRPGALLVTITGRDSGQFATSTLDEIRMELLRYRPLELFVDARDAVGAAVSVSDEWTQFFALNRQELKRVSILVGSKVLSLTVSIAKHMSRTENLIQIYSDPEVFNAAVTLATAQG